MVSSARERRIVKEIEKRFGSVIDLKKNPMVIIEILRQFGHVFDEDDGGGGVSPGVSTIAVGIDAGTGGGGGVSPGVNTVDDDELGPITNAMLLREILKLQRAIRALEKKLGAGAARAPAKTAKKR